IAVAAAGAGAQDAPAPLSRAQAVAAALARGARLGIARADSAAATAQLLGARALPNPTLSASYSKSVPRYHVTAELPIDLPWLRGPRVSAARAGQEAARYRFEAERAATVLDADTTYTRALAALAHARLSRRNADDADSLRRIAMRRRDAGDASDLDVELATVSAGQQANAAAADSLTYVSTLLDLQAVIGLAADRVVVTPIDSLAPPPPDSTAAAASGDGAATGADPVPLQVAAAEASLASARLAAQAQHRAVFPVPSVMFGFEEGDPTGSEPGVLPTFGISLPLPLLDRNRGAIAQAEAERQRAEAELSLARVESRAAIARATRGRAIALAKVARDQRLVESADRVAAMSLTAYREGASPLGNVLEAQRNARDVLAQYVDDVADAWIATATLRALTRFSTSPSTSTP
ncbi:MAG TPA: TolC family protein, partial [Gemmatimonadaceae bacterium]|nr:TolC family protein [Gemmatimonadaceae bacterium]